MRDGLPTEALPYEGCHSIISLTSSCLLLHEFPACLRLLSLIAVVIGGSFPYKRFFVFSLTQFYIPGIRGREIESHTWYSSSFLGLVLVCTPVSVILRASLLRNCVHFLLSVTSSYLARLLPISFLTITNYAFKRLQDATRTGATGSEMLRLPHGH